MLVMIVSVFLLTEVPQGVVTILSGLLEEWFYDNVYKALGDILDLLSLLNALVTFPLYCSMSQNYRRTFTRIFLNTDRWQQVRTYVDSRMSIRNGNVTGVISDKRSARYCEANGLELRGVTV